jgi:hydrogenase expression/formation protein HypD
VCVTNQSYINRLVELALTHDCCVLSFGDMLKVQGTQMSLAGAKAVGGRAEYFYTPLEVLQKAAQEPSTTFVVAAVGFETTAPVFALLADEVIRQNIKNVKFLTALKTMPQILDIVAAYPEIDGFLCPGNVAVITGEQPFRQIAEKHSKPCVVAGFDPQQITAAIFLLAQLIEQQKHGFFNIYKSAVNAKPQAKANALTEKYFAKGDGVWRGIGLVENSGLYLKPEFADYDCGSYTAGICSEEELTNGCRCSEVITGKIAPPQCGLFGTKCTPLTPIGPCMVSQEGACNAYSF